MPAPQFVVVHNRDRNGNPTNPSSGTSANATGSAQAASGSASGAAAGNDENEG